MGFCGYRYRFGLYAAHFNIAGNDDSLHYHNFTITLYINAAGRRPDENFKVEKAVQEWLKTYQGQNLGQMDLFIGRDTTVESMGNTFFDPLDTLVDSLGYELVKLEIYENPIRVYVVSNKRLDSTVNEIGSIPLECLPLIQLEENEVIITDDITGNDKESVSLYITSDENEVGHQKDFNNKIDRQEEQSGNTEDQNEVEKETAAASDTVNEIASVECVPSVMRNLTKIHKPNKALLFIKLILGLVCFASLAIVTMYIVKISGKYPQGSDTFCHLYRADLILKNIKQGNWYPLYDSTWYNGVEIMRYWGPLPLYLIAGLEWILQGNVLDAYVLFLGSLVIIGGIGWLLWGLSYNRVGLSVLIGLIWFYMPENIRVVIYEGNLPRGVINALLPFFFYFLWKVMVDKKKNLFWMLMLITSLITLCHLGITIMLLVSVIIFMILYSRMNHSVVYSFGALGACISGILLAGVWVVPALIGGAASGSSTNQVMKNFFESAVISLNPLLRLEGDLLSFYFGLSVFIVCVFGLLFGTKKVKPGFATAVILLLCTTNSAFTLFSKLPFSQFLWMIRFIPIGLAAAMVSFLMWKQLRKWVVLLLSLLLIADCAVSYRYIYFPASERSSDVQADLDARAEDLMLTRAKEITNQRMAVLDLSKYGSFAPYYITGVGKRVNYTFGAGWEGASTAENIVNLNACVEYGWYVYLFDRALELGNDTVLIPIQNLKEKSKDIDRVIQSAKANGFNLIENNGDSLLFHKDTVKQFGVVTDYENIAIGASASCIAMIFPSFQETTKDNINDYSFEELSKYKIIYLSGFTYDDKQKAEELLTKLSESGVRIYIDMNRVPVDRASKRMELFGVNAQTITFTDTYPELEYQDNTYTSLDFSPDISEWNTVYLNGLKQAEGYYYVDDKGFPFVGTSVNSNLHFIGLNIVYYLQTTRDAQIQKLVEAIFAADEYTLPDRQVVPVSIQTYSNRIEITSDYDNVNTTLSSIDIFSSSDNYRTDHNLILVDSGTTVIHIRYPHLPEGILVTLAGLGLAILTCLFLRKKREGHENEAFGEIRSS